MKLVQLQGTPWHMEQRRKTCNDGSKYCVYNHNICSNTACKFYHKKCVGKGNCDWFEPKTGTPKIYSSKTYKETEVENKLKTKEVSKMSMDNSSNKETKEAKFLRISKTRIDKVEEAIKNLENLSDKYSYSYTDEQVDKMFAYIEKCLKDAKGKFKNQKSSGGFEW